MSLPTASSSVTSVDDFKQSTFPSSRTLTDVSPLSRQSTLAAKPAAPPKKGLHFWLVMVAICVSLFLSALEYTAVSTALPTITHDLKGEDFVWVASAYSLASTSLLPMSGGMANILGRRTTMLIFLALFALGSALCGSAQSMDWLIAARAVQGAGGGGILSITSIIISDLVPLRERAIYNGLIGLTWAVASAIGPVVGGGLAQRGQWRWLFYLNLPVVGVAAILITLFVKMKTPEGSLKEKLARMDWIGNFLIVASSSAVVIALTWGGVRYPWTSPNVLVPLILGFVGMALFMVYEALVAKEPLVPFELISNRTSLSGYIQTFIAPTVMIASIYFMPIYFQACLGHSPMRSGVDILACAMTLGPMLVVTGVTIAVSKRYRPQLWVGWGLLVLAMGLFSIVKADTPLRNSIGFSVLLGLGAGIIYAATYFPVLAPLPVSQNANALAFFAFCRSFAGVWGVTIGTAVLQTQLGKKLPADFIEKFPGGVAIAYSAIPIIPSLPEPFRSEVRKAFADSLAVIWQVMIGVGAIGLLSCFFMKALPLHTSVDEKWGIEQEVEEKLSQKTQV